jgi:hypothetical protein
LTDFAIAYFTKLKEKYGKGRERQTELRIFDDIEATKVVLRNTKLYVNREEGFIGTGLKKDEYVTDCSDIDDVIVFLRDGNMMISKVDDKKFVGKDIIHVAIFDKSDKRTIYNMIYRDGKSGPAYIKRFQCFWRHARQIIRFDQRNQRFADLVFHLQSEWRSGSHYHLVAPSRQHQKTQMGFGFCFSCD